jgi:hypothetical protein
MFPTKGFVAIIIVLSIVLIGLVAWAIIFGLMVGNKNLAYNQSPFCLPTLCTKGTPYEYKIGSDTYQTVNFCTVNSVPTSFLHAIQDCSIPTDKLTSFAKFYDTQYLDTCGLNWANDPTDASGKQIDPVSEAIITCAGVKGISDNPNIKSIANKTKVT